jgi:D-glycero-D-manno-heptose 1,7-bisphosphate phosphatase
MNTRAIFIDRDGTLVHPRHYPTRPDALILYDGVAPELRRLQDAGYRLILITNQSGLARGLFGAEALDRMHRHLEDELARRGVRLDAIYVCPHHPEGAIAQWAVDCDCRKPRPGMLRRAADDLDLDLARSWFVGDILDDVEAGNRAGCRTVLVDLGTERPPTRSIRRPNFVARDSAHALRIIQSVEGLVAEADMTYRPPSWEGVPWRHGDAVPVACAG